MYHDNDIILGSGYKNSSMLPELVENTPKMVIFSKKIGLSAPLEAERIFYVTPKIFWRMFGVLLTSRRAYMSIPCAWLKKLTSEKKKAPQKRQFCLIFSFFELFRVVSERERKMKNSGSQNKTEWKYFSSVHNSIALSHLNKLMMSK